MAVRIRSVSSNKNQYQSVSKLAHRFLISVTNCSACSDSCWRTTLPKPMTSRDRVQPLKPTTSQDRLQLPRSVHPLEGYHSLGQYSAAHSCPGHSAVLFNVIRLSLFSSLLHRDWRGHL